MKQHLKQIEFHIGLRPAMPVEHPRWKPITKESAERLFFVPPPRGESSSITPHALPPVFGEARLATLEKARFAPDDPDALEKLLGK